MKILKHPILYCLDKQSSWLIYGLFYFVFFSEGDGESMKQKNQMWHMETQEEVDREHRAEQRREWERKKSWTAH